MFNDIEMTVQLLFRRLASRIGPFLRQATLLFVFLIAQFAFLFSSDADAPVPDGRPSRTPRHLQPAERERMPDRPFTPVPGIEPEAHPDILLVGYRRNVSRQDRQTMHAAVGARTIRSFNRIPVDVVRVEPGIRARDAMAAYQVRRDVVYVEPNYRLHKTMLPDDPMFEELWGLHNTGQSDGTPGADIRVTNVWATLGTGSSNVIVAVIDTGIDYTHADLAANMWLNPAPTFGDLYGARWTNGDGTITSGDPMDGDGHGTHVAGTIGAVGDNAIGVAGVNWTVRLMALKFLDDDGSGWTADAVAALEYAIEKGAHLSNNSWGGGGFSQALQDMIQAAGDANQLFIAAAGNSATDNDILPFYPSSYTNANIIAVASSMRDDLRSSFSSFGRNSVHLAAPGSAILSTVPGDDYDTYYGTSMASPHVAGAAALLLSLYPDTPYEVLKSWLMDGIRRIPNWTPLTRGGGIVNVDGSARIAALPAYAAPVNHFTADSSEGDHAVYLSWSNPTNTHFYGVTILRHEDRFPEHWTDGTTVYSGGAEVFEDGPHAQGTRFFYTVWALHQEGADFHYSAPRYDRARVGGDPDDYFTELFSDNDNDLAYVTVTFVPNGSLNGYKAYADPADEFPTDPAGGTVIPLPLDGYERIEPADNVNVWLYGVGYTQFYVGANGYITFGAGDMEYRESLTAHFRLPRISVLFDDFDPSSGGTVSWKQLADRIAVTHEKVPEFGTVNENSFQVEMFFDGQIRLTWLALAARDGLAGLSAGEGVPENFAQSDLSAYPSIDDLQIQPGTGLHALGFVGGPFTPSNIVYTLTNVGPDTITWTVTATAPWITLDSAGSILPPGEHTHLTVHINDSANLFEHGMYEEALHFSNNVSGRVHIRPVTLTVAREGMTALYFADLYVGDNYVLPALQRAGYIIAEVSDWDDFNAHLETNAFTLAIALNHWGGMYADTLMIENYLAAGGKFIAVDWTEDPFFAGLFEAQYTHTYDQARIHITSDELAEGVANPLPLHDPGYGSLWSMGLDPTGNAQSLGDFPNADSALVWGNNGQTMLLGFMADTVSKENAPPFYDNLIRLVEVGADALHVSPITGWSASGYQQGPFAPTSHVYTISNVGSNELYWTAQVTSNWVATDMSGGSLEVGASTGLTVYLTAEAYALQPGTYHDQLILSNTVSGKQIVRQLSLTAIPLPGEIHVFDSISPTNDWSMPFGELIVGQSRTEYITVHNADPQYGLIINGISILSSRPESPDGAAHAPPANGPADISVDRAPKPDPKHGWHPDTLLVGFKHAYDVQKRDDVHAAVGAQRVHRYKRIATDVVRLPKGSDIKILIEMYEAQPGIAYAEPNYVLHTFLEPDDPRYGDLWALNNAGQTGGTPGADISAPRAWNITTGSSNVLVAILDTGIDYNHPDLAANRWINPAPTFGDIHGARWTSGDGTATSGDPMDGHRHGTHVAGTVGAVGNNGVGIVGVNWNVRLMALKFLADSGTGFTADAVAALEYAIEKGAHLSNNSWGGGSFSQALKDMIAAAGDANQLFIAAAGNTTSDNDVNPRYPCGYNLDNIIAVASSDHNDQRSSFSNYGRNSVHLAAPGSSILSTVLNNGYSTLSGTSMAVPHVAGTAALMLSVNPAAPYTMIKEALLESVDIKPAWMNHTISGGRLNAAAALQALNPHFRLDSVDVLPHTVPPGETWTFSVTYQPIEAGTHTGYVRIVSNDTNAPIVDVSISGSAVNDALAIHPETPFLSEGERGGPFTPDGAAYTLTNSGLTSLDWNAAVHADWLDVSPANGTLHPGDNLELTVSINALAETLSPGTYHAPLVISNVTTGIRNVRTVQLAVGISLCEALDACELTWTTGGNVPWFAQTNVTHDGVAAAQSGRITHNQASWIETTVQGPGNLSFWWKVSSEANYDYLEFHINGVLQHRISGEMDWQQKVYELGAGEHTLRWRYSKDASVNHGLDSGWLDQVTFNEHTLLVTPLAGYTASGAPGGPFVPSHQVFTISNTAPDGLDWGVSTDTDWVDVSFAGSTLSGHAYTSITVHLNSEVEALDYGAYAGALVFTNSRDETALVRALQLFVESPLCEAVDACALIWTSGGDARWFAQTNVTYDGVDAAQSGPITHNQESWIETTVEGPGTLVFWWKVSSEAHWDLLEFGINGEQQARLSGEVDWEQKAYELEPGEHTLRWRYSKDFSINHGSDSAWLDQVLLIPPNYDDAFDHAGHYTIEPNGLIHGANEGIGFEPWDIQLGAGAVAMLADSTESAGNINSSNNAAFRFYGGSNFTDVIATRPFEAPLRTSDVFRVTLTYNESAGARGVRILDADGSELFTLNYGSGNVLSYKWGYWETPRNLSTAYSPTAVVHVTVTQLENDMLRVKIERPPGFAAQLISSLLGAPAAQVQFYDGGHSSDTVNYALHANNLRITRYYNLTDQIPNWWWEGNNIEIARRAANLVIFEDGYTYLDAFIADTNPNDPSSRFPLAQAEQEEAGTMHMIINPTSVNRIYRVMWTTDLTDKPQDWMLYEPEKPGTGNELRFTVTNDAPGRIYRTGVRLP